MIADFLSVTARETAQGIRAPTEAGNWLLEETLYAGGARLGFARVQVPQDLIHEAIDT